MIKALIVIGIGITALVYGRIGLYLQHHGIGGFGYVNAVFDKDDEECKDAKFVAAMYWPFILIFWSHKRG